MRKIFDQGKTIYISDRFDEISGLAEGILEYPFEGGLLNLLKEENRLRQSYVLIRKKDSLPISLSPTICLIGRSAWNICRRRLGMAIRTAHPAKSWTRTASRTIVCWDL